MPAPDLGHGTSPFAVVFTNIGELVTCDANIGEGILGVHRDAALVVEDGRVAWLGPSGDAPAADRRVDVAGRAVLPGWVDSHAHLVFAGDRAEEFAARMAGRAYSAGGIRTTVAATRAAGDDVLRGTLTRLVAEALRQGTTTIECKSGYGLTVEDEARSVRIAAEVTTETTYLGAHVVPPDIDTQSYLELLTGPMLDACAPHARFVDAFVERGAFDADQARSVLTAGIDRGLLPKVHANQLGPGPGVALAVEVAAVSADHCTHLSRADVDALAGSATIATLLPGAEFSTRSPYPDARALIDAGATVALATDCNPGSSYTTSMPLCVALAVREMRMSVEEAIWSATEGGARALRRDDVGRLTPGARADLQVLDAPTATHVAYRPGVPLVHQVWRGGERVV
ncbi:MAG TPA: imidazolonepropionase [Actinomycetes bacterium]|nr:imidazolonepropionase [Actinomycetes bacterium]